MYARDFGLGTVSLCYGANMVSLSNRARFPSLSFGCGEGGEMERRDRQGGERSSVAWDRAEEKKTKRKRDLAIIML